mmetsp:Transcript_30389/g.66644  ORF Transcript_30389/g.66644 Transcript_30389/m.66644 type:complete len:451 (+) Transcript_30389:36-1388(+)
MAACSVRAARRVQLALLRRKELAIFEESVSHHLSFQSLASETMGMPQRLVGAYAASSQARKVIAATIPASECRFTATRSLLRPHRRQPLQQLVMQPRRVCHSILGRHYSSGARSAQPDPPAQSANTSDDAAETADEQTRQPRRGFLVRNDRNDVKVLRCETSRDLQDAMEQLRALPHFCAAGETNAGKSSMLNHLMKKQLARSSSVSCKTRTVDMFELNSRLVVTDLPGIPSRDHQGVVQWERDYEPLVFEYLRECTSLRALLYLHDIRWKVSPAARDFLRRVRGFGVPILLVLTKDDKLVAQATESASAAKMEAEMRLRLTTRTRRAMNFNGLHVHYSVVSALPKGRSGRRTLLRLLEQMVAADSREDCARILAAIAAKKQAAIAGDKQAAIAGGAHDGAQAASSPPHTREGAEQALGRHAQQHPQQPPQQPPGAAAAAAATQPASVHA